MSRVSFQVWFLGSLFVALGLRVEGVKSFPFSPKKHSNPGRKDPEATLRRARKSVWGDQKGQCSFLINYVFNYRENGLPRSRYFVDLAAGDGKKESNTFVFERHLGWTGLLIEANPEFASLARECRTSPVIEEVVSDVSGESIQFRLDNGYLGGIVSEDTDNNWNTRSSELESAVIQTFSTRTLEEILDVEGAPEDIDYLSLDVEGAEHLVLRSFPFQKYRFRAMTIERPNFELCLLLDQAEYIQLAHLSGDIVFVHSAFMQDISKEIPPFEFVALGPKGW